MFFMTRYDKCKLCNAIDEVDRYGVREINYLPMEEKNVFSRPIDGRSLLETKILENLKNNCDRENRNVFAINIEEAELHFDCHQYDVIAVLCKLEEKGFIQNEIIHGELDLLESGFLHVVIKVECLFFYS